MTKAEATKKLIEYCNDQVRKSGFLIFNKRDISVAPTRLFEQYERTANLKLPPKISFPKGINWYTIDFNGIDLGRTYQWCDIAATAIKTEGIALTEDRTRYDRYLLICLNNGEILEKELGDIDEYHGQLGHFIEQYKMASRL
jgi:hypothetical protein